MKKRKAFITGIKWQGYIDGKWTDFCKRATFEAEEYFDLDIEWCLGIRPFTPYNTAYDMQFSHLPKEEPGHGEHKLRQAGTNVVIPARRIYSRGLHQADVHELAHSIGPPAIHTPPYWASGIRWSCPLTTTSLYACWACRGRRRARGCPMAGA